VRINDIVENYISKRIKKDAQIEAFNKQIQSAQKEKQRAETKDEKDVIRKRIDSLQSKKKTYLINKRKNKDLNRITEAAEDTTLERYRKEIENEKKSSKRRIQMTDDPLQKEKIKDAAEKKIRDREKKIETLKNKKIITPLPYKKPEKKNLMRGKPEATIKGEGVMIDEKEIKAALDAFENDDFITAKEKLKTQIVQAKNDYLKNKLGLSGDLSKDEKN